MATATKTAITIQAATANAASGSTTSAPWNLATALGGVIQARISNGGSAPTLGCDLLVQISTDGVIWRDFSRQSAGNSAGTTYDFVVELPAPILQARVVFSGNTGQAVTVEALGHELTAIG
jgi:hypothetical protein